MKAPHRLVAAGIGAALLAACGDGFSSSAPTTAEPQRSMQSLGSQRGSAGSGSYRVKKALQTLTYLHSFGTSYDGYSPYGPLVDANGTLYGTTESGGTAEGGTVYSVTPSGSYGVVYNFSGQPNGANPYAGLASLNGTLYGTTYNGGISDAGTVYSITTGGTESVIQNFYGGSYGQQPYAGLVAAGGKLYGTTSGGGVYNAGTAFSLSTSGAESVLHQFGGPYDGVNPEAPLLKVGNTFYGTTNSGGPNNAGIVFAVAKSSGHETILHNFGNAYDGASPEYGKLVNINGTLYGTTYYGGTSNRGTIYSIASTGSGTYTVVHNFTGGTDGCNPAAGLVVYNGLLYGTASRCGAYSRGTIFAFDPTSNSVTPVWAFGGSPGGATPSADLIVLNGTIYGTTLGGGTFNEGTVFSLVSTL